MTFDQLFDKYIQPLVSLEPKAVWPGADEFEKELNDYMGYQDGGEEIYSE